MEGSIIKMVTSYLLALAHPTRIEILELLKDKNEMCVCEIVEKLGKEQSNISRHLNTLKAVDIVELRDEGTRSFYRIKHKDVDEVIDLVKSILHKQAKERQKILEAF